MPPETRQVHIGHTAGRVEPRQDVAQFCGMFSHDAARVVILVQAFQAPVTYRLNHSPL
jgi:hypothetical protein